MSFMDNLLYMPPPSLHHWGYFILFIMAILESTPIGGIIIPGQTVVIFGGVLVKFGILNFWWVIILSASGAIIGDYIGFIVGKKYGYSFLAKYGKYFFFKKEYLKKTKKLMHGHAGKALILGRFNGLTRAFAPFVAGTSKVKFGKFLFFNIVGGISWAVSFTLIGVIFSESFEVISRHIGKYSMIALGIIIAVALGYHFINKRRHIFQSYHFKILLINIPCLYFFFKLLDDVVNQDWITRADAILNKQIFAIASPLLDKMMIILSYLTGPDLFLFVPLLIIGILIYKKRYAQSLLMFLSIGIGNLLSTLVKALVERPRPVEAMMQYDNFSFPSYHAMMSMILFSMIIYLFKDGIKNKFWRYLFVTANVLAILIIGFDRMYLHVHYFSDVLAGFALGLFWVTLLILIFKLISGLKKKTLWEKISRLWKDVDPRIE